MFRIYSRIQKNYTIHKKADVNFRYCGVEFVNLETVYLDFLLLFIEIFIDAHNILLLLAATP